MQHLTKDDLIQKLDEIEFFPELKASLDGYLDCFIAAKDRDMIARLLKAGASPNPQGDLCDYMGHLMHEYEVNKTAKGELILSIMELLLENGANPNRVFMNNLRAYDYAVSKNTIEVVRLLEKYGADRHLREVI